MPDGDYYESLLESGVILGLPLIIGIFLMNKFERLKLELGLGIKELEDLLNIKELD